MSINIKQHNDNMRIEIKETWEFSDDKKFKECFDKLLEFKRSHGKLADFKKNGETKGSDNDTA